MRLRTILAAAAFSGGVGIAQAQNVQPDVPTSGENFVTPYDSGKVNAKKPPRSNLELPNCGAKPNYTNVGKGTCLFNGQGEKDFEQVSGVRVIADSFYQGSTVVSGTTKTKIAGVLDGDIADPLSGCGMPLYRKTSLSSPFCEYSGPVGGKNSYQINGHLCQIDSYKKGTRVTAQVICTPPTLNNQ